ncbi:MAG: hypothetical protein ACRDQA_29985 [Nocardioidaceae bacterium]
MSRKWDPSHAGEAHPADDVACVRALTALHDIDAGLLVCHPQPGATWPFLVGDLLHSLGKHHRALARERCTRAAVDLLRVWLRAEQIRHLVLLRAHLLRPVLLDTARRSRRCRRRASLAGLAPPRPTADHRTERAVASRRSGTASRRPSTTCGRAEQRVRGHVRGGAHRGTLVARDCADRRPVAWPAGGRATATHRYGTPSPAAVSPRSFSG